MKEKDKEIKQREGESILVVDDTPENLHLLINMLAEKGYKTRAAATGNRALATIAKEPPDLILLDVMMPDMDGYEVCRCLKQDNILKDIPVIFISALTDTFDILKAFQSGAVDYVNKPFQAEEVFARVKTHLALKKTQETLKEKNRQLEAALHDIKTLKGLLPICSKCKKIRKSNADPRQSQSWVQLEAYLDQHTDATFTHSYCPDCASDVYREIKAIESQTKGK